MSRYLAWRHNKTIQPMSVDQNNASAAFLVDHAISLLAEAMLMRYNADYADARITLDKDPYDFVAEELIEGIDIVGAGMSIVKFSEILRKAAEAHLAIGVADRDGHKISLYSCDAIYYASGRRYFGDCYDLHERYQLFAFQYFKGPRRKYSPCGTNRDVPAFWEEYPDENTSDLKMRTHQFWRKKCLLQAAAYFEAQGD